MTPREPALPHHDPCHPTPRRTRSATLPAARTTGCRIAPRSPRTTPPGDIR
ncbi:hypothetical protein [Nocardia sp. NPDC020380]|uniref:hypothetical protein n=1 Tax=Nocardia sp. NPDC020380 TaxID=3364309 RepID=UPI0037B6F143